jgi:hypothetical protein
MADTVPEIIQAEPEALPEQPVRKRFLPWTPAWHQVALLGIALISIFMDFFQLGQNDQRSSTIALCCMPVSLVAKTRRRHQAH